MSKLWPWDDSYVHGLQAENAELRALIVAAGTLLKQAEYKGREFLIDKRGDDSLLTQRQAELWALIVGADS